MNLTPDKILGPEGKQAKMFITKYEGGRQAIKLIIDKGFNWTESIKPNLPGCPDWCPATHFGYLESGIMKIQMKDGTINTIKAGETYFVPPGHLPIIEEKAIMIEFSQDTTYTNKEFIEKNK